MRIGIDARFVGPEGTGLGKYTEKLIENLQEVDQKNSYCIFLKQDNWSYLTLKNKNFSKVLANVNWYSLHEQIKMSAIFSNQNLDLLHVPHFNVPVLYRKKFIVTIHDLIHHDFNQESATTRNPVIFKIKRLAYKITIDHAIKKSAKIIVPSNFVKEEISKVFRVDSGKIIVTYEAAEEKYFQKPKISKPKTQKYLLYVGNAYPHKNLEKLLDAIKILTLNSQLSTLKLVIVCPRDIFWHRLDAQIKNRNLQSKVTLYGYLPTDNLVKLFKNAQAYVSSSLSEGFGLPGLNAFAAGIPVVASNIPTFQEIYGNAALYFNPKDKNDIAAQIKKLISDENLKEKLIKKGKDQAKKYSWRQMAQKTLNVYQECLIGKQRSPPF